MVVRSPCSADGTGSRVIPTGAAESAYFRWMQAPVRIGNHTVMVATKPGVSAHGGTDPAAMMLAEWIADRAAPVPSARSLHLACGNGLVAAVAREQGYAVTAYDRALPNVDAARRTLGDAADVHHAALPSIAHGSCRLATLRIPTDRLSAQLAVVTALRCLAPSGMLLVAGANDEGIKPLAKWIAATLGAVRVDAQHSGHRLLAVTRADIMPAVDPELARWLNPDAWHYAPVTVGGESFDNCSRPGVFSWAHLDEATAVLGTVLQQHPVPPHARVLDLGCGTGALGVLAARQAWAGHVMLLDADADAVRSAAETLRRAGVVHAEVRASDVANAIADERFNVILSNPPFHVGKATALDVPRAFIEAAHDLLVPGGALRLVANRTLPYERWITDRFGSVDTLHDGQRFKVLGATRW